MKKIILERGEGKTVELIKLSSETRDIIVCSSKSERDRIKIHANSIGLIIPTPITYSDFTNKRYRGRAIGGFLIDNVETFLSYISDGVPVNGIALNP